MKRLLIMAASAAGFLTLVTAAQAFHLAPPVAEREQSLINKVSDGGDCGWFAISVCSRGRGGARRAARQFGGRVIDTGDVSGFRAGWYCAVVGPSGKRSARRAMRDMRFDGARSAYLKRGCL